MSLELWLALIGICFLGAASPGPSLVVILRIAMRQGMHKGLLAAWSHAAAIGLYALLSILFFTSARALGGHWFWLVAAAGQIWLLYLGSQMLRSALRPAASQPEAAASAAASEHWLQGLVIGLFNPKIWLFFTAVFSPFIATIDSAGRLALVPFLIDGLWYSLIVSGVTRGRLARHLAQWQRGMDALMGTVLLALGLFALSESLPSLWVAVTA